MQCTYNYVRGLSLKVQFVVGFTVLSLIVLVVSIMVLKSQINELRDATIASLNSINDVDYASATILTAKSVKCGILSQFLALSQQLYSLQLTYNYFQPSSSLYTSSESSTPLPPPSSFPTTPNSSAVALYKLNSSSPDYSQFSYFDVILPTLLSSSTTVVKRFNILFINPQNVSQTVIRTTPATSDFQFKASSKVFGRILSQNQPGTVLISLPYEDYYANTGYLMYIGTEIVVNSTLSIILQAEMIVVNMEATFYNFVIYFPNAILGYVFTSGNQSELFSSSFKGDDSQINITDVMTHNLSRVWIQGNEYLVALTHFPMTFPINNLSAIFSDPTGPYTIMVLSPISSMSTPSDSYISFVSNYAYVVNFSFGMGSLITLMTALSFSFLAASILTYPLNKLTKGIKMFLTGKNATSVAYMLNAFKSKYQIKKLISNTLGIMDGIEAQRDRNVGGVVEQEIYQFPENPCDTDFLKKMRCRALGVWQPIEQQLSQQRKIPDHAQTY